MHTAFGPPTRRAIAFSVDEVVAMMAASPFGLAGARDIAMIALGFCAALRRSEIAALQVEDLQEIDGAEGQHALLVRRSKTDQHGQGYWLPVRDGDRVRPIFWTRCWLMEAGIEEGRLFRAVTNGELEASISAATINQVVKRAAARIGLTRGVSAHSLRAGYVTAAIAAGVPHDQVMDVSRHSSYRTVRQYVRNRQAPAPFF